MPDGRLFNWKTSVIARWQSVVCKQVRCPPPGFFYKRPDLHFSPVNPLPRYANAVTGNPRQTADFPGRTAGDSFPPTQHHPPSEFFFLFAPFQTGFCISYRYASWEVSIPSKKKPLWRPGSCPYDDSWPFSFFPLLFLQHHLTERPGFLPTPLWTWTSVLS